MTDLTKIEKALVSRSEEELSDIVDHFIAEIGLLNFKYGGSMNIVLRDDTTKWVLGDNDKLRILLLKMLVERNLDGMLKVKSAELLTKLDLIKTN
jgi:hypothetical protein